MRKDEVRGVFGRGARRVFIELDVSWIFQNKDLYSKYLIKKTDNSGKDHILLPLFLNLYADESERVKILYRDEERRMLATRSGFVSVDTPKDEPRQYMGWTSILEYRPMHDTSPTMNLITPTQADEEVTPDEIHFGETEKTT